MFVCCAIQKEREKPDNLWKAHLEALDLAKEKEEIGDFAEAQALRQEVCYLAGATLRPVTPRIANQHDVCKVFVLHWGLSGAKPILHVFRPQLSRCKLAQRRMQRHSAFPPK